MRNNENPKSKNEMGYTKKRNALHALLSPCVVRRCGTHRAEDFTVTFVHEVRIFDGVRAKFDGVDAFFSIHPHA
jgi:hypothetical protein